MPDPILQDSETAAIVTLVEASTTVEIDEGGTLVEVTLQETPVSVTQVEASITVVSESGPPEQIPGPPQGLEPWTQLTVVESPETSPVVAQDKYRYSVGVLFPSDHAGPGYPPEPGIVALRLPASPYDGYEFSWMDRDNGFSADAYLWIQPAPGATYDIDGFPAGDGLVLDVVDFNNGLAYCAQTNSWNLVFARTELVGFGQVLIKGQFQAHLGIPAAAVDGEFWEATTAGTILGSTIKVDDVCIFRENKTRVNVIPRITAADEAGAAVTTAVATAASAAAALYVPLSQRNANNGVATLGGTGQLVQMVPAANLVETASKRLVSDAEKASWNAKLDASAYNEHFRGKYTSLAALQTAIPSGNNGDNAVVDPGTGVDVVEYLWDAEEGWVQTGDVAASTTDALVEGSLNLYHTPGRAAAAAFGALLTGISFATNAAVTAANSLLEAIGRLQAQITWLGQTKTTTLKTPQALTSSAGVVTIDCSATEDHYTLTPTENISGWTFTNRPTAGTFRKIYVTVTQHASAAKTIVSPASAGSTAGGEWEVTTALAAVETLELWVYNSTVTLFPGGVHA